MICAGNVVKGGETAISRLQDGRLAVFRAPGNSLNIWQVLNNNNFRFVIIYICIKFVYISKNRKNFLRLRESWC